VLYHVATGRGLKFQVKPAGLVVYHNTFITEARSGDMSSNVHFRNNLFLGNDAPRRGIFGFATATSYSTFDYDGYRPNRNARRQFEWRAPAKGTLRDYALSREDANTFDSLAAFRSATGHEQHGIEVDFDIFESMTPPDPDNPYSVYEARDINFRLKPGSKAVDAGVPIPNLNDGYRGSGPDLGALEVGGAQPHYGPRPTIVR
jgi:hypothetical protein